MHRLFVWLLAASIASPLPAGAITFVDRDFDEVVLLAEQILVGTVVRAASRRVDGGMIVTDFMLGDVEGLHGVDGRSEFTVTTAGGTIGDLTLSIAGAPQLEIGGRYMMFVKGNGSTMFPFIGGPLGIFVVRRLDDGTEQMFSYGGRPAGRRSSDAGSHEAENRRLLHAARGRSLQGAIR